MIASQLYCPDDRRRARVRAEHPIDRNGDPVNGIDYLQVLDDDAPAGTAPQQTLLVHCLQPPAGLTEDNVVIEGGVRVIGIVVEWAKQGSTLTPTEAAEVGPLDDPASVLVVRTDRRGDFSTYRLRLVLSPAAPDRPAPTFDPLLAAVDFSFKVDCPSAFDCRQPDTCVEPEEPPPPIDYLVKDYASFRRLMLDRLALLMPEWRERNPADAGVALVELLAYAADRVSYYQDAAATEAYLGTARRRPSVRRHARLVDYRMHDGAAARTWVCFDVDRVVDLDNETPVLTADEGGPHVVPELTDAIAARNTIFETLHDQRLTPERNDVTLHTWGDPDCCLPAGATSATLVQADPPLDLEKGDVLLFEEVLSPTGSEADADPSRRHAVRLSADPVPAVDALDDLDVLNVEWHVEDALPFALCARVFEPEGGGHPVGATVVHANIVLADHGRTMSRDDLPAPVEGRRYRPWLGRTGITQVVPYRHDLAREKAAAHAAAVDPRAALPDIHLTGGDDTWDPQRDLLASDRFAREFVVETEEDGSARLRFGDGVNGRSPAIGVELHAYYRVGNGRAGNVGAESLVRVVTDQPGITGVRNPMPAAGGVDPESLEQVRLDAPEAFRTQERAVTEEDYARVSERLSEVQRAAATRRWTGSWYTMFVTVDRRSGHPVDAAFEAELRAFLDTYRLAGYDVEIDAPHFVALEIELEVCVSPGFLRADVQRALTDALSARDLPGGGRGLFHPDDWTFAQPVHLSQVVAAAMAVDGVEWIKPTVFKRWREDARPGEEERLEIGRLEIARLDNDPSQPENGHLELVMKGGL